MIHRQRGAQHRSVSHIVSSAGIVSDILAAHTADEPNSREKLPLIVGKTSRRIPSMTSGYAPRSAVSVARPSAIHLTRSQL